MPFMMQIRYWQAYSIGTVFKSLWGTPMYLRYTEAITDI